MTEQVIQTAIKEKLSVNGWLVIKMIVTSHNGVPDLVALKDGAAVFIEVKKRGGRLSEIQRYRLKQLINQGFDAIVAYSTKDIDHLIN